MHYIVTAIDYASNYPECLLTSDICSAKLISWFKDLFSWYGNPDQLVSDNGPQFISAEFSNFLNMHIIEHICTAIHNPSENGLIKVFNRVLKYSMQCFQNATFQAPHFGSQPGLHWKSGIQELLKAYRATSPRPGKKCPAELFFGQPFCLDFQLLVKKPEQLAACRVLLHGPFAIGDPVLMK